jgi:hypothetical protein
VQETRHLATVPSKPARTGGGGLKGLQNSVTGVTKLCKHPAAELLALKRFALSVFSAFIFGAAGRAFQNRYVFRVVRDLNLRDLRVHVYLAPAAGIPTQTQMGFPTYVWPDGWAMMPAAVCDRAQTRPKAKNTATPQGPKAHATGFVEML